MKFGKRLGAEAGRGWDGTFLDYKACKRAISKDVILEDANGGTFEAVLRSELRKINTFFTEKEEELEAVMQNIQNQSGMLTAVRTEVLALRKFSVLNATAVIKAVKKRNKHLGKALTQTVQPVCATQLLSQQYFFTSSKVAKMLTQAEIQSKDFSTESSAARVLEDYECPICLAVLENPVMLSCAHRFCWGCLLSHCATCHDVEPTTPDEAAKPEKPRERLLTAMLGSTRTVSTYPCPVCRQAHPLDLDRLQVDSQLAAFIADVKRRQLQPERTTIVASSALAGSATSTVLLPSQPAQPQSVQLLLKTQRDEKLEAPKDLVEAEVKLQTSEQEVTEKEVEAQEAEHGPTPPLLPPQVGAMRGRLTVVLDLDGTLISSFTPRRAPSFSRSCTSYTVGKGAKLNPNGVLVVERPELKQFFEELDKFAEVVVFTAGLEDYASPICRRLESRYGNFQATLYRPATVAAKEYPCVKDLSLLGRDLRKTVLVDDTPLAFLHQPDNGIPIFSFRGDEDDRVLPEAILPLLQQLASCEDVRPILHRRFNMPHWLLSHGISTTPRQLPAKPPKVPKPAGVKQIGATSSTAAHPPALGKKEPISDVLILSDFDKTLTDYDAGERLVGELAPELVPMLASLQQPANFVPLTNAVMRELARRGVGADRVNAVLRQMGAELPVASKAFLEWASSQHVDVRIISDCNTHFIGHMLQGAGVSDLVKQVITNSANFESSQWNDSAKDLHVMGQSKAATEAGQENSQHLIINPCHDSDTLGSHSCPFCPANLCKGAELSRLRTENPYKRIIYLGDGANDLCPALRLQQQDVVLARQNYDLDRLIEKRKSEMKATTFQWSTHQELFKLLREVS